MQTFFDLAVASDETDKAIKAFELELAAKRELLRTKRKNIDDAEPQKHRSELVEAHTYCNANEVYLLNKNENSIFTTFQSICRRTNSI